MGSEAGALNVFILSRIIRNRHSLNEGIKHMSYDEILYFWFDESDPKQWWQKNIEFDEIVKARFLEIHRAAVQGELSDWRQQSRGRLAEILVLDQFSRNIYRHSALSFAQDGMALVLAQECIAQNLAQDLNQSERAFLYMPFMHSESMVIHERAVELFSEPGLEENLDFELKHKRIIDRFGRYPHRNQILGRQSRAEELFFLRQPDSSF